MQIIPIRLRLPILQRLRQICLMLARMHLFNPSYRLQSTTQPMARYKLGFLLRLQGYQEI